MLTALKNKKKMNTVEKWEIYMNTNFTRKKIQMAMKYKKTLNLNYNKKIIRYYFYISYRWKLKSMVTPSIDKGCVKVF